MSFYEDPQLRRVFLGFSLSARRIYDAIAALGELSLSLKDAREVIQLYGSPSETGISGAELRNWIRPESEAAMGLTLRSPGVAEGADAEVDLGAGTTHASYFSILSDFDGRRWLKQRLAFFGVRSEAVGMDAIDSKLAKEQGLAQADCLLLRGHERTALTRAGLSAVSNVLAGMREAYVLACRQAAPRLNPPEKESFRNHQVFITGGGSLVPEICQVFAQHPDGYEHMLRVRRLGTPQDLCRTDREPVTLDEIPFLAVAYGFSYDAIEIPEALTAIDLEPPVRLRREFIPFEDM